MTYWITSTSQLIDIATIKSGCEQLRQQAKHFQTAAKHVSRAADICNPEALSVDGASMQPVITDTATAISNKRAELLSVANAVEADAQRIYNEQVAEYNAYLERLEEQGKIEIDRSSSLRVYR